MSTLALDGGTPVRTEPFPRRILIGEEEIETLHNLLEKERTRGGGLDRYGGEHVDAYEREFAAYHGVAYATATSSGTAAIHAALGALHLDIAQEVISSPDHRSGRRGSYLVEQLHPHLCRCQRGDDEYRPGLHRGAHYRPHQGDHRHTPGQASPRIWTPLWRSRAHITCR